MISRHHVPGSVLTLRISLRGFKFLFPVYFLLFESSTKCFAIHFKTSLPVTFTSICMLTSTSRRDRDGNVSLGGMAG